MHTYEGLITSLLLQYEVKKVLQENLDLCTSVLLTLYKNKLHLNAGLGSGSPL